VIAALVVIDVVVCADTVTPESTPLIKIFIPATLGVAPALLGVAVKTICVESVAELNKAEAFGAVLTRKIESLFNVTNAVPPVFAEAASLGVYVYPVEPEVIDKVSSVTRR